jgi:undecaprenyl-phosphate galactose phosphotransferase
MSIKGSFYKEYALNQSFEFKRLFDVVLGFLLTVLSFPLWLLIACLIKLTSRGPIFYRSWRMGKEGVLFPCWKFRTMHPNADQKLDECLKNNPELLNEWKKYLKLKNDPRVTWIGKWLRKTSLDELPQFWNVLRGELSLVGPRPYLVEEVHNILGSKAYTILSVRPGITGLWQVSGRNAIPFSERIRLDEEYVMKRSFYLDLSLLFKTIPSVLFAKGH